MTDGADSRLTVCRLSAGAEKAWDDFVNNCAHATFFHRAGWKKLIEGSFGHECHFLFAESGGRIRGVLPLVHVRSRIFGNSLVSSAFCVYGGPAASDAAAEAALNAAAEETAASCRVDYLEYRLRACTLEGWAWNSELYVTFRKAIAPDPVENLLAIPRKQRAMVRKGEKHGLVSEEDWETDRFFSLYSQSVRDLGTPVFPRSYFGNLKSTFGDDCRIFTVVDESLPVASVMCFYFRDEVLPYYGGGSQRARSTAGYDFMYWDVMKRACGDGFRVFDFGRSKRGTGAYAFKKNWGFEPAPLHYGYRLLRTKELPALNPTNPKYRLAISAWKRLPLPLANLIGPCLSRSLG